jgi:hypothetical protein
MDNDNVHFISKYKYFARSNWIHIIPRDEIYWEIMISKEKEETVYPMFTDKFSYFFIIIFLFYKFLLPKFK